MRNYGGTREVSGFTIDRGVPIPTSSQAILDPLYVALCALLEGDSIFIHIDATYDTVQYVHNRVHGARNAVQKRFPERAYMARKTKERIDANGGDALGAVLEGIRIWRTKDGTRRVHEKARKAAEAVAAENVAVER